MRSSYGCKQSFTSAARAPLRLLAAGIRWYLLGSEALAAAAYQRIHFLEARRPVKTGDRIMRRAVEAHHLPGAEMRRGENDALALRECGAHVLFAAHLFNQRQQPRLRPAPQRARLAHGLAGFDQAAAQQGALLSSGEFGQAQRNVA